MFYDSEGFAEWIHDDITWCADECSNTACERNLANRLTKDGMYSAAKFKDTETCPLYRNTERSKRFCGVDNKEMHKVLYNLLNIEDRLELNDEELTSFDIAIQCVTAIMNRMIHDKPIEWD